MNANEVLPSRLVAVGTRTGQRQILEMERRQIPFDVRSGRVAIKTMIPARGQDRGEPGHGHVPPIRIGTRVEPGYQRRVEHFSVDCIVGFFEAVD
jgi:hypothetical protein